MSGTMIEHEGVVEGTRPGRLVVKLRVESACQACHAKEACQIFDCEDKIIEVLQPSAGAYRVGDLVTVVMTATTGWQAVALAYLFPLLLLTAILVIGSLFLAEGLAGIVALGSLVPYYFILYLFRDKLKKRLILRLKS